MNTDTKEKKKALIGLLYQDVGAILATTAQTAKAVQRSEISLIRDRANGTGIKYIKTSKTTQGRVHYSIDDIADFLLENTSL